ncbi:MAG TPA: ATP-binding protein [Nevskiaceae bacterium]
MSLSARLLLAASCVLVVFMVAAAAGLEQAFIQSALQSERDRSQGLVYALLAAAESQPGAGLSVPLGALPDPRLARPQSGLEAVIFNSRGNAVWRSPNLAGPLPPVTAPSVGNSLLEQTDKRFVFSYGVRWHAEHERAHRYTVTLLEDDTAYEAQLAVYRHTLWSSLATAALTLVILQFLLLRWSLAPLRRLAAEVRRIESGDRHEIRGHYPRELTTLARNLNDLIRNGRTHLARYRNALGDLAHSLKTPLALLRALAEDEAMPEALRRRMDEPVTRIQYITDYQLRRAAAAAHGVLAAPVDIHELTDKVLSALAKVYTERHFELRNAVDEGLQFRVDEGDLYEIVGNLADNACKWARHVVMVSATRRPGTTLVVEDDGPGFPADTDRLLTRGVRADTRVAGQGIGLATVADIVLPGGGDIELGRSATLGGARVVVRWPA